MSITAILTLYKRPYTLIEQLEAVQNQSVPPESVIIWKNSVEGVDLPDIPKELMKNVTIIDSSNNFGVWARFCVGLLASTKYICVFDDDTIPQKHWFKNCIDTMKVKRGLLGTIGICFDEGSKYRGHRFGWDGCSNTIQQVDIVGHAWFFEQEWLSLLWQFKPDYNIMLRAGEDIAFAYCLQRAGINTYVPPHPKDNVELWGSNPHTAMKYGCDSSAISQLPESGHIFGMLLEHFICYLGFETISNRKAKEEGRKPF